MEGWMIAVIFAVIAVGCFLYMKMSGTSHSTGAVHVTSRPAGNTTSRRVSEHRITETGPMVYFANDRHGNGDREYRFNYKKVNGSWRAYILRMPDLRGRSDGCVETHRLRDGNSFFVCWDSPVKSLKDMQNISRAWADAIQEYIATGKRFG